MKKMTLKLGQQLLIGLSFLILAAPGQASPLPFSATPRLWNLLSEKLPQAILEGSVSDSLLSDLNENVTAYKAQQKKPNLKEVESLREDWLVSAMKVRRLQLRYKVGDDEELRQYFEKGTITRKSADAFAASIAHGGPEWIFLLRKSQQYGITNLGEPFAPTYRVFTSSLEDRETSESSEQKISIDLEKAMANQRRPFAPVLIEYYLSIVFTIAQPIDLAKSDFNKTEAGRNLKSLQQILALEKDLHFENLNVLRNLVLNNQAQISTSKINCTGWPRIKNFVKKPILLDPGHLGGEFADDGRNSCVTAPNHPACGYREGVATLIMAHLTKRYLTECAGVPADKILILRKGDSDVAGLFFDKGGRISQEPSATRTVFDNLPFRMSLIRLLDPSMTVSIHTDAVEEQMGTVYSQRSPNDSQISFYKTENSVQLSKDFSNVMKGSLEDTFFSNPTTACAGAGRREIKYDFNGFSIAQSDYHIFRGGIHAPVILVETFSHRSTDLKAKSNLAFKSVGESYGQISVDQKTYGFLQAHDCTAQGIARGIIQQIHRH